MSFRLNAEELSMNKGKPISINYRHRWTEKTAREYGRHNMMYFQRYISKNYKTLVYDENTHGDVDVLTYAINRDETLDEEEKDFLLHMNFGRIMQIYDEKVNDVVLLKVPKVVMVPTEILSRLETIFVPEEKNVIEDNLIIEGNQFSMRTRGTVQLILSEDEFKAKEMKALRIQQTVNFQRFIAEWFTEYGAQDFVLFDLEYKRKEKRSDLWTRVYTQYAIVDAEANVLRSGVVKDVNELYYDIMGLLANKVVLVKGGGAELDFINRIFDANEYYTTKQYRDKRKVNGMVDCNFLVVDLELFRIEKYPGSCHIPEKELIFFLKAFRKEIERRRSYRGFVKNPYYGMLEKRAYDIEVLRWSWLLKDKFYFMGILYKKKLDRFVLQTNSVLNVIEGTRLNDFSYLAHQKLLFYLCYCDVFVHTDISCYIHQRYRCGVCRSSIERSFAVKDKYFDDFQEAALFLVYLNYVTGGTNGMILVPEDKEMAEYIEAFKDTDIKSLFDTIDSEGFDLTMLVE